MVSLENSSRPGGSSFSNEHLINYDDEVFDERGALSAEDAPHFKKIHTVWSSVLVLLCLIAVEVLLYIIPLWCDSGQCTLKTTSALLCLQCACWGVLLLNHQYLRLQHRTFTRCGHLLFYRKTQILRHGPLYVFSLGNVGLLLMSTLFQELCFKTECRQIMYLQLFMTVEVVFSFVTVGKYLGLIVKFNHTKPLPDVRHDNLFASFSQVQVPQSEIGYKEGNLVDDIMEKQADLIHYLKQHNEDLGRKINQLTNELAQRSG